MAVQWHPIFARLVGILLDKYYEIQTEVPVSDLPRKADLLVIHRQDGPPPPFNGLWSHLTEWNVLEYKGPTDTAHDDDLEKLVHVGTGLTCRLNEERLANQLDRLPTRRMSFWYLAPTLGETFMGQAQERAAFVYESGGIWRGKVWGHPIWLVSSNDTRVELDTIPLHLLAPDPAERDQLKHLLLDHEEELRLFSRWVSALDPVLWKEIRAMALTREKGLKIDWDLIAEHTDLRDILDYIPAQQIIERLGLPKVVDTSGPEKIMNALLDKVPPEVLQEMIRKRQQSS